MRTIKLFEEFNSNSISNSINETEIIKICHEYGIKDYTINKDGSIDVDGDVNLFNKALSKIPVKFNKVNGNFDCHVNNLNSLKGCPKIITGYFNCGNNRLSTLEDGPEEVGNSFYCGYNNLKNLKGSPKTIVSWFNCVYNDLISLEGGPESVGAHFYCQYNQLTTLKGCPKSISRNFICDNNKLKSLEGCPKEVGGIFNCGENKLTSFEGCPDRIGHDFICDDNPVFELWKLFLNYQHMELFIDLDIVRDGNIIILQRLNEFLDMIEKPRVTEVKGYKCI